MRVKIIIVAVLTIAILILAFLLFKPNDGQKIEKESSSIKPKTSTTITNESKKQTNEEFGIKFEYPGNYELTESAGTSLYGSSEAVVYTFTEATRPYTAPFKLSLHKILEIKTIDELVSKIKVDYPDIITRSCRPKAPDSSCVALITKKGATPPPFHFVQQYDFGLIAATMDFQEIDTVLYDDYDLYGGFIVPPLREVFNTLELIK